MRRTAIVTALALLASLAFAQGNYQISDQDTFGYLFAHQSAHGGWTAYALSPDAIHFHSLLCGDAIMDNVNAPYVCRTKDGKGFIMTVAGANGRIEIKTSSNLLDWKDVSVRPTLPRGASVRGPQIIWDAQFVDASKVGCIGASYGGFMSEYIPTITDFFACAVSHAGISDHTSYWGFGYWGYSYSEVSMANSYPWSDQDLYVKQSPLYRADKINTPLLLVHGDADTNVPFNESVQ